MSFRLEFTPLSFIIVIWKEKTPKEKTFSGSNPNRKLPTAASKKKKEKASAAASETSKPKPNGTPSTSSGYSAQQAAVNDMMRRALEEDQYSALGSIVDTDSSDDDIDRGDEVPSIRWNHRPKRGSSSSGGGLDTAKPWVQEPVKKLDRNAIVCAMRRHLRVEGMKSVRNFESSTFLDDAEDYNERGRLAGKRSHPPDEEGVPEEDLAVDGRKIGKRRKKKKGSRSSSSQQQQLQQQQSDSGTSLASESKRDGSSTGTPDDEGWDENDAASGADDDGVDIMGEEEESSIFGQTTGASNATWVECDRCKKVSFIHIICTSM